MVTVETISIVFTGLSVSLAAFYYISTLRNAQKTRELSLRAQEISLKNQEISIKNQEITLETRQAQLFMPIYSRFHDKEFMKDFMNIVVIWEWDDYDDFWEKYGLEKNIEAYSSYLAWMDYLEGIGVLVKRNLIDASLIDDLISGLVMRFWEKTEGMVKEYRLRINYPQFAEFVEYLYNEVKAIALQQHPELKT